MILLITLFILYCIVYAHHDDHSQTRINPFLLNTTRNECKSKKCMELKKRLYCTYVVRTRVSYVRTYDEEQPPRSIQIVVKTSISIIHIDVLHHWHWLMS